jgi:hypothetical protein
LAVLATALNLRKKLYAILPKGEVARNLYLLVHHRVFRCYGRDLVESKMSLELGSTNV